MHNIRRCGTERDTEWEMFSSLSTRVYNYAPRCLIETAYACPLYVYMCV